MIIGALTVKLYAPWVHSLKEKRMVVNSITSRVNNTFHVSIAEIAEQDTHQTIVLGIAFVAGTAALADSITDKIINYIEDNTEAEILDIQREIR